MVEINDHKVKISFDLVAKDPEVNAINIIIDILDNLELPSNRLRVLDYLHSRYYEE